MEKRRFKTLDEQLTILKDRGLVIDDEKKAYDYLLSNNYYNIINGYSKYFQKKEATDLYLDNANFDEVCHLYFFDKEIKQLFLNAILSIEHHLKSILAYRFAEAYPNKRYGYLDVGCYNQDKVLEIMYTISGISKIIKKNMKYPDNAISYYVQKYDDVPIWVIVDFLNFGDLRSLIFCLPTRTQNKIAKDLCDFIKSNNADFNSTFSPETMNSFIKNIHETRNICAHNNRLLEFNCRSNTLYFSPLHQKYGLSPSDQKKSTYSTFLILQCFLSKKEYSVLHNSLRKRIRHLSNSLKSIDIDYILELLGFPRDWHQAPPLNQDK